MQAIIHSNTKVEFVPDSAIFHPDIKLVKVDASLEPFTSTISFKYTDDTFHPTDLEAFRSVALSLIRDIRKNLENTIPAEVSTSNIPLFITSLSERGMTKLNTLVIGIISKTYTGATVTFDAEGIPYIVPVDEVVTVHGQLNNHLQKIIVNYGHVYLAIKEATSATDILSIIDNYKQSK